MRPFEVGEVVVLKDYPSTPVTIIALWQGHATVLFARGEVNTYPPEQLERPFR